jgi:hypothetical protein
MKYYKDHDYNLINFNKDDLLLKLYYSDKPTLAEIKHDLDYIRNRYNKGSIYNAFNPNIVIVYKYIWGYDAGYCAYIVHDSNADNQYDKPFIDEPTIGKFFRKKYNLFN